jgi:hypothetical protein
VIRPVKFTIDPYEVVRDVLDTEVDDLAFTYAKSLCVGEGIDLGSDEFIEYYQRVRDVYSSGGDRLVYFMHMSMITVCTILESSGMRIDVPADLDDEAAGKALSSLVLESARCVAAALMHVYATEPDSVPTNAEFANVPADARSVSFTFTREVHDDQL